MKDLELKNQDRARVWDTALRQLWATPQDFVDGIAAIPFDSPPPRLDWQEVCEIGKAVRS